VARNRYIKATQDYNVLVRQFPVNLTAMVFGYKEKAQFTVENEAAVQKAPTVDFGAKKVARRLPRTSLRMITRLCRFLLAAALLLPAAVLAPMRACPMARWRCRRWRA